MHMLRRFLALVMTVPAVTLIAAEQPSRAPAVATGLSVSVLEIGNIPAGRDQAPVYFVDSAFICSGTWRGGRGLYAQPIVRQPDGAWIVEDAFTAGTETPRDGERAWSLPLRMLERDQLRVLAIVLVAAPLPPGPLTSVRWRQVLARSAEYRVSNQRFDRSRLQVISVGGRPVRPGLPMPVREIDEVTIQAEGLPLHAMVNVILTPESTSRVWIEDHVVIVRDGVLQTQAHFGRTPIASASDRDMHAHIDVVAVATVWPLPVRANGFLAREWFNFNRYIRVASPSVPTIRAVSSSQAEVEIREMGLSHDGVTWLANPVSRVAGTFTAGPRYRRRGPERITLLVRVEHSTSWFVAATASLRSDRLWWVMPSANLLPPGADAARDTMRAIAVLSNVPFRPTQPVSSDDIEARQLALSRDVIYRLQTRAGGPQ